MALSFKSPMKTSPMTISTNRINTRLTNSRLVQRFLLAAEILASKAGQAGNMTSVAKSIEMELKFYFPKMGGIKRPGQED